MLPRARPPQDGATLYQNGAVPGRSRSFGNEHDQKVYLERNDPEQGTSRFQKNGNEWNEVVPGTRSFLLVPGYEHSTGTRFLE